MSQATSSPASPAPRPITSLGVMDVLLLPVGCVSLIVVVLALVLSFIHEGVLHLVRKMPPLRWLMEGGSALLEKLARALGDRILDDKRDTPILHLLLVSTFTVVPLFALQLAVGELDWRLALLFYLSLYGPAFRQFVRVFSAKHNEAHRVRGLFASPYRYVLGRYYEWFLGFFYGNCPELDHSAHVRMHHFENGGPGDPRTSVGYNHSSLPHFLLYFSRSFLSTVGYRATVYFWRHKAWGWVRRMLLGIAAFVTYEALLFAYDWRLGLVYGVVPFILLNFIATLVDWVQHAFFDSTNVKDFHASTATVLYEGDFLYEGYHLAHHDRSSLHWSELPAHFEHSRARMAQADAIVFQGIDYVQFFLLLLGGRYEVLAERFVDLGGRDRGREELIQFLKERAGAASPAPLLSPVA